MKSAQLFEHDFLKLFLDSTGPNGESPNWFTCAVCWVRFKWLHRSIPNCPRCKEIEERTK